jgi:dolichol-phosphate mannosyltransferase
MDYERYLGRLVPQAIRSVRYRVIQHSGRFVRFGLVGAAGVLVNMILLYFGVALARLPALVAAGIVTELTILGNFVLNDRWTFRDRRTHRPGLHRMATYNGIALGGMLISLAVLATLTHFLGVHYLVANLFGIGAATLWNYIINARFTWHGPAPNPSST